MQANSDDDAVQRRAVEQWERDPALRAEFADNRQACVAYFKAEARGLIRVRRRPNGGSAGTARIPQSAAAYTDGDAADCWDRDAMVREEFCGNRAAFIAFARADALGRIRILGGGKVLTWQPLAAAETAPAQAAASKNARPEMSDAEHRAFQRERWDRFSGLRMLAPDFETFLGYIKNGFPKTSRIKSDASTGAGFKVRETQV